MIRISAAHAERIFLIFRPFLPMTCFILNGCIVLKTVWIGDTGLTFLVSGFINLKVIDMGQPLTCTSVGFNEVTTPNNQEECGLSRTETSSPMDTSCGSFAATDENCSGGIGIICFANMLCLILLTWRTLPRYQMM